MTASGAKHAKRAAYRPPTLTGIAYGLAVIATTAIIGGTVLTATRDVLLSSEREYLRGTVRTAAAILDGDAVASIARPDQEKTKEYLAAVRPLFALDSADHEIVHAFTSTVRGDTMIVQLDAASASAKNSDGTPVHWSFGTRLPVTPEARGVWGSRVTFVADDPTHSPWGDVLEGSSPLFTRNGRLVATVNLTIGLKRYHAQIQRLDNIVFVGAGIGLLLAILSGLAAYRVEVSRRSAEEQLIRAKLAAEASASAKGEFLANMSHEIRTPLHGVLGMSEVMLSSAQTEADRRSLEVINKSASSLLVILNDILDYSKLEAGRVELVNAPFDPRALVDDVSDLFAVKAAEQGLELAVRESLRADRWPIGDASRLKQVLLNLVGNGVKFTATGSVRVDLETMTVGRTTIALRVAVRDTGIGISDETQQRLFEQFAQGEASTSRRFGGTGLGLAISRQLVVLMGGTLTVKSAVDQGSEFIVDIQLPISSSTRDAAVLPRLPVGSRALVCCALPLTREAIVEMLTRAGVTAEPVSTEAAALARIKSGARFACIFAEAPETKSSTPSPFAGWPVPLVVITSLHQPLNNSALSMIGAAAQLRRPVREDHLDALLSELAAGRLGSKARHTVMETPGAAMRAVGRERPRILVVDDVELNLMVARAMLGSLGAMVTSAAGGALSIAALEKEKFDLVFMDCHMPEIDGYEVTRRIRAANGLNAKTPIVALSASAFAEDRLRALESGMNDFAPKPIEMNGLSAVLQAWIPGFIPPAARKTETSTA